MNTLQCASNFYLERVGFESKVNMRRDLKNGDNRVGRAGSPGVDIGVDSLNCSVEHCMIMVKENIVVVKNLNESNGTSVNGTNIKKDTEVEAYEKDLIGIIGRSKPNLELNGNFNYVVYRLCKYSNENLRTFEIDDNEIIEIEDDSDNEGVTSNESINSNEVLDKKKFQDENVDELMNYCRDLKIEANTDKANVTVVNNGSSQYPHSDSNASNVDVSKDTVCSAPMSPKGHNVSSNEVSCCTCSSAIEADEGSKEKCNPNINTNVNNKLKETVTKLICKAKTKRRPEIIIARPLETGRKSKFEDSSTSISRKLQTHYVTKEERNERLRIIAAKKTKNAVENREKRRIPVKVKVTENNRGSFLTDASQIPILPGQRKLLNAKLFS